MGYSIRESMKPQLRGRRADSPSSTASVPYDWNEYPYWESIRRRVLRAGPTIRGIWIFGSLLLEKSGCVRSVPSGDQHVFGAVIACRRGAGGLIPTTQFAIPRRAPSPERSSSSSATTLVLPCSSGLPVLAIIVPSLVRNLNELIVHSASSFLFHLSWLHISSFSSIRTTSTDCKPLRRASSFSSTPGSLEPISDHIVNHGSLITTRVRPPL